ncbi:hypothetical protein QQ045_014228 [Rhodiola kirilowii]
MAPWLPHIISEEQVGFIKGREIHENIALAHDLTHDLNHKVFGGNLSIKLDMAKAYDRVCVSNYFYSVKWDGKLFGFFKSARGVRQGDPLFPTLFVIAMEWFSRIINAEVGHGVICPYITKRQVVQVNHLLFADDLLNFTNGAKNSIKNLLDIIGNCCKVSGQQLISSKSSIIVPDNFLSWRKEEIIRISGFAEGNLLVAYLGVPLFRGRVRIDMFSALVDKVTARVNGWMKRFLSMGGKVTLVNSVLNSVGIHSMMALPVPITILNRFMSLMANFIWDSGGEKHHHWKAWQDLCKPKHSGGLGIRDPRGVMLAVHGKMAWSYLER